MNFLALNASIESARAGEAWKDFAVGDNKIGKLTEETGASTEQYKKKTIKFNKNLQKQLIR